MESPNPKTRKTRLLVPSFESKLVVIMTIIVSLLLLAALAGLLFTQHGDKRLVKPDQYQAVFLSNGQYYFGKLENIDSDYVTLRDIYYLKVNEQVQPSTSDTQQSQVSLTKLGSELHGPEDEMHIDRDKIVFWENLKAESRIVKAIGELKNK